jgi:pimeloyl-ACP methyl ester carboxylesterase
MPKMPGVDFLEISHGLPKNYRVILTDPRGSGCNEDPEGPLPHEAFRTKYLADDVLALVRALNLEDYILMGHSYGSILATQVAVRSSKGEAPPPRAVVLMGVVGRSLNSNEQEDAFNREWRAIWRDLPPSLRQIFPDDLNLFEDAKGLPFAETGDKWFSYIENKLGEGVVLVKGTPLVADLRTKLMDLLSSDSAKQEELRQEVAESQSEKTGLATSPIFLQIACREVFPPDTEFCRENNIPQSDPFDSAVWQIDVPLYYVHGANDPITPVQQAQYHFDHQKNPNRRMITVPRAGHAGVMALLECKEGFWASILGGANLDTSLRSCSAQPLVAHP